MRVFFKSQLLEAWIESGIPIFLKFAYVIFFLVLLVSSQTIRANESNTPLNPLIVAAERYEDYSRFLKDKRVGIVANQTSMVGQQHLIDFLLNKQANITRVFSPEHGFSGRFEAGERVSDDSSVMANLKFVSLYGKNKKLQPKDIQAVDTLVFDIQDVGVRFYTYISTLHYLMESCAKENLSLIVLDRPNPNGDYIDGPLLNLDYKSFVGMHPIPIVHGLTVGELALMINGEGWLKDNKRCDLTVIPVKNYSHSTRYSLPVKPSPNLPNDLSVRLYPSLALFEATQVSVGRGTDWPFQVLGYPNKELGKFEFSAKTINGSWGRLNYAGKTLYGERVFDEANNGISLQFLLTWQDKFEEKDIEFINRPAFFDKLSGNKELRQQVAAKLSENEIKYSWSKDLLQFQELRRKYLLYPDHPKVLRFVKNQTDARADFLKN